MNSVYLIIFAATAVLTGAGTYMLTHRDFSRRGRVLAAIGCAILVGATSLYIPYLPVLAFLAAAAAYLVIRRLIRVGPAPLVLAAVVLVGGLAFCVLTMITALNNM